MTGSDARSMVVATVVIATVVIAAFVVPVDIMDVDRHAAVGAAAGRGADRRGVADHAKHGGLLGCRRAGGKARLAVAVRGRVVAPVALVEPHLVGAGDVGDVGVVMGRGVDHQRGDVVRV